MLLNSRVRVSMSFLIVPNPPLLSMSLRRRSRSRPPTGLARRAGRSRSSLAPLSRGQRRSSYRRASPRRRLRRSFPRRRWRSSSNAEKDHETVEGLQEGIERLDVSSEPTPVEGLQDVSSKPTPVGGLQEVIAGLDVSSAQQKRPRQLPKRPAASLDDSDASEPELQSLEAEGPEGGAQRREYDPNKIFTPITSPSKKQRKIWESTSSDAEERPSLNLATT